MEPKTIIHIVNQTADNHENFSRHNFIVTEEPSGGIVIEYDDGKVNKSVKINELKLLSSSSSEDAVEIVWDKLDQLIEDIKEEIEPDKIKPLTGRGLL